MTALLVLPGLVLLALGGELLVRGAVAGAERLGVSPLLAGLTIVGFGTSTPELVTSLEAAMAGSAGIAIGNVIGSNIANILLILGLSALILPLAVAPAAFRRDALALAASTVAATICVLSGAAGRLAGVVLLMALVGYVLWAYLGERKAAGPESEMRVHMAEDAMPKTRPGWPLIVLLVFAGIAAAIGGAQLLVEGAVALARSWNAPEAVIGLTVVAVGTSLPEMIVCVVAAIRKHADVALGNVVGSNIYNIFGILGVTAIVQPLAIPAQIAAIDIWVLVGATGLLLVFLRSGWRIVRWEGAAFVALYAIYCAALFLGGAVPAP